ncbi:MAG: PKD domain-containing protein, partial [Bacteroidetes bacterium]
GYPESLASGDNFVGYAVVGGAFYTGSTFPPEYHGAYFVADHSGWIRALRFDLNDTLTSVTEIVRDTSKITDLAMNPLDGSLYYVTFPRGLHKLSFGVNVPPVPVLAAEPLYGPGPLTVQFSAAESYDPQGESFSLQWDFGDGQTSTDWAPEHTFVPSGSGPESFTVLLTATDSAGQVSIVSQRIWVNNSPPQVEITSFPDGMTYPMGGPTWVPLAGTATDAEHPEEDLTYVWQTYLHHNTHFHPEPADTARETGTLLPPAGCEDEIYFYRVRLEVTDPEGLAGHRDYYLYPECVDRFVEMTELQAEVVGGLPELSWYVSREDSAAGYEVQWAPGNQQFVAIGYLPATGAGQTYRFSHETPAQPTNTYRLRLIHADGRSVYSGEEDIIFLDSWMRTFPNPVQNILTVEFDHTTAGPVTWELFDLQGRPVQRLVWDDLVAGGRKEVDLYGLPRGTYLYRTTDGQHQRMGKVIRVE